MSIYYKSYRIVKGEAKWVITDECPNCQIEDGCSCIGNPNNNNYKLVLEQLKSLG